MNQENSKELPLLENIPARGRSHERARLERLRFLQNKTGVELKSFASANIQAESLRGNIENYIGTIALPVGIAGPLLLHHSDGVNTVYAPIATTEGALVASITRGARAISLSDGVHSRFINQRMTRAPFFEFDRLETAFHFDDWIKTQFKDLQKLIKNYSNFSILQSIEARHIGRTVHLVFSYSTGDAAGQNMTTICTWQACQYLLAQMQSKFTLRNFCLEGNLSTDKKASVGSAARGRGSEVTAECLIRGDVLRDVLLVSAKDMEHALDTSKSARIQSGMLANNINTANVIAGIFAATGQDIACVHESSVAELHLEAQGEDLYAAIYLPSLTVGTVGGGTRFDGQKEMLQLMDCYGAGKIERFAETIAGFALALDLSTLAAMVGGQFASSHSRLGRPQTVGLQKKNLAEVVAREVGASQVEALENFNMGDSMVMELSSQVTTKLCGFFPFKAQWDDGREAKILMKVKPTDNDIILATETMGTMCSAQLGEILSSTKHLSLFKSCHEKELQILKLDNPVLKRLAPKVYDVLIESRKQIFASITELETDLELKNAADDLNGWTDQHTLEAIHSIAEFHSCYYQKAEAFKSLPWIGYTPTAETLIGQQALFAEMARIAHNQFPTWYPYSLKQSVDQIIADIPQWSATMQKMPHTLIHNDFNPRNLAFRQDSNRRLCVFDWELATVHLPQRDLVELLCFVNVLDKTQLLFFIEQHRDRLVELTGVNIEKNEWLLGCRFALYEFMIHRLALYSVAHVHRSCEFLPRTYLAAQNFLEFLKESTDDIIR